MECATKKKKVAKLKRAKRKYGKKTVISWYININVDIYKFAKII